MIRRVTAAGVALFAAALASQASQAQCPAAGTRAVMLKTISDGDTFIASDGAEVDLAGVLAPGSGGERITLAQIKESETALTRELTQGALTLAFAGPEKDRYGRLQAQVFAGNEWVQGALLRAGVVRANPDMAEACAAELLAAEAQARDAKRGSWGNDGFAVLTPEKLAHKEGTFQIVEGKVLAVATQKSRVYLNFGANWHTDFTVTIAPQDMKLFRRAKFNVKGLAGKRVRVRGWIESYYGPEIEIAQPSAIEALDPVPPAEPARKTKQPGRETPGLQNSP